MNKLHVIYVAGLGDNRSYGQAIAIKLWRVFGVHGHYHAIGWSEGDFTPKLEKLLVEIDDYVARGHQVALLGFSAGASAVLNAFSARKDTIAAVVCISGFIQENRMTDTSQWRHRTFAESVALLHANLKTFTIQDKRHILTVYPAQDKRVSHTDATVSGVNEIRTPAKGHVQSIAYALTIGAFSISKYMKKQARLSATMTPGSK